MKRSLFAISIIAMLFAAPIFGQEPLEWMPYGDLNIRASYPVTVRMKPNIALVAGGYVAEIFSEPKSDAQLFIMEDGVVRQETLPPMWAKRAEFPMVIFGDSLAYAVGGFGNHPRQVDEFNLRTKTWRVVGDLTEGRRQHVAYQLNDDEIIVVGGRAEQTGSAGSSSAEIFNVKTGLSRRVKDYPHRTNGAENGRTSLGDGIILGGRAGNINSARSPNVYTYDAANDDWTVLGMMQTGLEAPDAYQLEDGRFCLVGGSESESPVVFIGRVFLETNGTFNTIASVPYGLSYTAVTEHVVGELLVVGGWLSDLSSTARCTFVDVSTGDVRPAPTLETARRYVRSVTLTDGGSRVTLAIGGISNRGPVFDIEYLGKPIAPTDCVGSKINVLTSKNELRLNGEARLKDSTLLLTSTAQFSRGGGWMRRKVNVAKPFTVEFSFTLSDGTDNDLKDGGPEGADGIVMVLQDQAPSSIGEAGQGIRYHKMPHGVAVEFDSYLNGSLSDPSASHVAVQVGDGQQLSASHRAPYLRAITSEGPELIADSSVYYGRVEYNGKELMVWLSEQESLETPILTVPLNLLAEINPNLDSSAWLGFVSATGFSVEEHELLTWQFTGCDKVVSVLDEEIASSLVPLNIAPNPSKGFANLQFARLEGVHVEIEVYDLLGALVHKGETKSGHYELSLTDTVPGSYIVQLGSKGRILGREIVVIQR